MRPLLLPAFLLALVGVALPHGGTFPGGPSNGGNPDVGGPSGPSAGNPNGAGPSFGGPAGGSYAGPADAAPTGAPRGGGPASTPGPAPTGPAARTGGGSGAAPVGQAPSAGPSVTALDFASALDTTAWSVWWHYNQAPYLDLRRAVHAGGIATGSDEFYLGRNEIARIPGSLLPSEPQIRERILPLLLELLEGDPQPDVASSALVALAKAGLALDGYEALRVEGRLRPWLAAKSQEVSETAALSLAILARPSSIPLLRALALDEPAGREAVGRREVAARTRAFAAYGLGLVGARVEEPALRRSIAATLVEIVAAPPSPTPDLQAAALLALGLVPVEGAPRGAERPGKAAAQGVATREDEVRAVLRTLGDPRGQRLVRAQAPIALARLADADDPALRAEAVRALCRALDPRAAERMEVERGAAIALGRLADLDGDAHDRLARRTLIAALEDAKDAMVERYAAIALGRVGGRPGEGEAPGEGYAEVRRVLLLRLSRESSTPTRPWAALALGVVQRARVEARAAPDPEIASALRACLADCRSPEQVGAYAIAVGLGRDPDGAPLLARALERFADDEARGHLALALGLCGERDRREPLRAIVEGARFRPTLLGQASIGLALLGDKDLVPALVGELSSARSLASQASIATALGRIGDSRSVEPLIALLRSPEITESARGFAAVALGIVADPRALPFNVELAVDSNYASATATQTDPGGAGVLDIL